MKTSSSLPGISPRAPAISFFFLLCILSAFVPTALAEESQSAPPTFLGQTAEFTTEIHDNQLYSGSGKAVDAYVKYQNALQAGLEEAARSDSFNKLGKYAKILDYGLKVIKFGDLGVQGTQALYAGDREGFRTAFNTAVREAVKTGAGMAGAYGGGAAGVQIGIWGGGAVSLPAAGVGAVPGAAIGGFAGSWLGDALASGGAGIVYDWMLEDYVKNDMADFIFDQVSSDAAGDTSSPAPPQSPLIFPPSTPAGNSSGPPSTRSPSGGNGGGGLKPFR